VLRPLQCQICAAKVSHDNLHTLDMHREQGPFTLTSVQMTPRGSLQTPLRGHLRGADHLEGVMVCALHHSPYRVFLFLSFILCFALLLFLFFLSGCSFPVSAFGRNGVQSPGLSFWFSFRHAAVDRFPNASHRFALKTVRSAFAGLSFAAWLSAHSNCCAAGHPYRCSHSSGLLRWSAPAACTALVREGAIQR
jgi:hypothetical protein